MSPSPQETSATTRRLTKRSPSAWSGVGQKSSEAELIGPGKFSGEPHGSLFLALVDTQMSRPPLPPARFEAWYRLSPSGDWIGHPSRDAVFRSAWLPPMSSIFCAVVHGAKWIALAAPAVMPKRIVAAMSAWRSPYKVPPSVGQCADARKGG